MNALLALYPGDDALVVAASTLAQITLVGLLALVILHAAARRSPAVRHGVCLCALFCILSSPALASGLRHSGTSIHLPPGTRMAGAGPADAAPDRPSPGEAPEDRASFRRVAAALFALWALGACWLLLRLGLAARAAARLARGAVPLPARLLERTGPQVRAALGLRELPRIACSRGTRVPLATGVLRPVVLLPEALPAELSEAQLRDVLVHECAHLALRHPLTGLVQGVASALFWPHPLVHLLDRELCRAREELCDNFVLACSAAPEYARTLLAVAERRGGRAPVPDTRVESAAVAAATGPTESSGKWPAGAASLRPRLRDRVEGLLDRRRERRTAWSRWQAASCSGLLLAATVSVAATGVTEAAVQPHLRFRAGGPRRPVSERAALRVGEPLRRAGLRTPEPGPRR